MASSKRDFERFVAWLHSPANQAPPDVKRLANLILARFDAVARTSHHRSQRSIYLVSEARQHMAQTTDDPPDIVAAPADGTWPWKRLRSMTIGPFRGFRNPEPFDLQKRIILCYGPNGSGKTSFCEGLEFGLLGSVEEAEAKRIDWRTYLANLHARRFEAPTLQATDHKNRAVAVLANADTFRFCFIEKNRIDAFSRIAARPPAQRTELIATLFGMEKFNEFVTQFNESIDGQLVTMATKKLALDGKRNALSNDQATANGEAQALLDLAAEEAALAAAYQEGMSYEGLKSFIGKTDAPGRLQELDGILNSLPLPIIGVSRDGLLGAFEATCAAQEELARIVANLKARSSQVSFKELYNAVLTLQSAQGAHCPACDTPLANTKSNPFKKAIAGLAELKELGDLQEKRKVAEGKVDTTSRDLRLQLGSLSAFLCSQNEQETPVGRFLAGVPAEPLGEWWSVVYPARQPQDGVESDAVTLEAILAVADRIAAQDATSASDRQNREKHVAERANLVALQMTIHAKDLKRKQLVDDVAAAKARIAAFEKDNARLIADVAQETLDLARDSLIKAAYDSFLALLRSYRNQLPGMLLVGLNDAAMNLYNEFNRNDLDADKLAALHFPLNGEQKIEIAFRGNPGVRVDALQILSEGHIRCLGLAILLAKAQSIQSPLVVFDDAINAIDHDHRGGIRETIFESDHFADTQLIVTCHSNEFIKDIQQHLQAQRREDCTVYLFRSHTGDYHPRVSGNALIKNYVAKARASKDSLDHREALTACRQGLEMLSEKVWHWLGSHGLGELILPLAGVGTEPGLRNLCDALRKRLSGATYFNHPYKATLLTAYGRILGIPYTNLVWTYLNKGTHEEANRDDFDNELVEFVVQTLEEIDRLNLRRGV